MRRCLHANSAAPVTTMAPAANNGPAGRVATSSVAIATTGVGGLVGVAAVVGGAAVVGVGEVEVVEIAVVVVGVVVVVVDDVVVEVEVVDVVEVVVEEVVEELDTGGVPPRADSTSAVNDPATYVWRLSPGQVVLLIERWPLMVEVVTSAPAGHLFEPLEVKVTWAPGAVEMPYRSANQASSRTSEVMEACEGWALL